MNKILLSIPLYNCELQIPRVINSITKNIEIFDEIILFDNGSLDKTIDNLNKILSKHFSKEKFKVFQNNYNINLGGSHMNIFDYFLYSNCDYLVVLHGDDQGEISNFIDFNKKKDIKEYDWVKFSRFMKCSKLIGYSKIKEIGNQFFNILFSLSSFKRVYDIGSGLDLYSKKFIKNCPYINFPNDLTFDYFMTLYGLESNLIFFYPQTWKEYDQISNVRIIKQTLTLIKIFLNFLLYRIGLNRNFFKNKHNNLSIKLREYHQII